MAQSFPPIQHVILAGGSGACLWPLLREHWPKQFLSLLGPDTVLQQTLQRLNGLDCAPPIAICNEASRFLAAERLRRIGMVPAALLLEPVVGRNTVPAIALVALRPTTEGDDPLLLVLVADCVIQGVVAFHHVVGQACSVGTRTSWSRSASCRIVKKLAMATSGGLPASSKSLGRAGGITGMAAGSCSGPADIYGNRRRLARDPDRVPQGAEQCPSKLARSRAALRVPSPHWASAFAGEPGGRPAADDRGAVRFLAGCRRYRPARRHARTRFARTLIPGHRPPWNAVLGPLSCTNGYFVIGASPPARCMIAFTY